MDHDQAEEDATDIDVGVDAKAIAGSPADEEPETLEHPVSMSVRVPDPLTAVAKSKTPAQAAPAVPILTPSEPFRTTASVRIQTLPDDPDHPAAEPDDTLDVAPRAPTVERVPLEEVDTETETETETETSTSIMLDAEVRAAFISVLSSSTDEATPGVEVRSPQVSASELPTDPVKEAPDISHIVTDPDEPDDESRAEDPTLKKQAQPAPRARAGTMPMPAPAPAPALAPAPAPASALAPAPAPALAPASSPPPRRRRSFALYLLFGALFGITAGVALWRPSLLGITESAVAAPTAQAAPSASSSAAPSASASASEPSTSSAVTSPSAKPRPGGPSRRPRPRAAPAASTPQKPAGGPVPATGQTPAPAVSKSFEPSAI